MAECEWWDSLCPARNALEEFADGAIGEALNGIASVVIEGFGRMIAAMGSMWLFVPSGAITQGTSAERLPPPPPSMTDPVNLLLSYVSWYSLILSVISLTILGAIITMRHRNGEAYMAVGKLGIVLGAVAGIGAAPMLVRLIILMSRQPLVSSTVQWLQDSLLWITLAVGIGGLMVSAARMAWQMRAEPGHAALRDLIRLSIVVGASIPVLGILLKAGDEFSKYFFLLSTSCDVSVSGGACFGENLGKMLLLSGELGAWLLIIFCNIGIGVSFGQIALMIFRSAAVIILAGTAPTAAAAAMAGQKGHQWWEKNLSWLIAWVLYKPVAAIVYGTAFMLVGTPAKDANDVITIITGLMMMIIALIALPALMRLITPLVSAMASTAAAGGGFAGAMAGSMLPTGAQAIKNLFSGSGGGGGGGGSKPPTGNSQPSSTTPATGNPGTQKPEQPHTGDSTGNEAGAGKPPATGTPASTPTGAPATGGSAATGAGAGAGAAAGGPVGLGVAAAGAVADGAKQVGQQVKQFGEESMGDPSGNK